MTVFLLILHGLIGVALLGAITHQATAVLRGHGPRRPGFLSRYATVDRPLFTGIVALLFVLDACLGAVIYPRYRLDVRVPFEEMQLGWAVGLFEIKEHFAGIGLATVPVYLQSWRTDCGADSHSVRRAFTLLMAFVIWWDFLAGHVINNLRGLT